MAKQKSSPPPGLGVTEPVRVKLSEVSFAEYNPRIMPPDKMRALKASLEKYGLVLNLVIQKKGMTLIGGHQRVTAARELCKEHGWPMPEFAYAAVLDVDDRTAKELNVALNNIEGEFDPYKLGVLFTEIHGQMTGTDMAATGFSEAQIQELMRYALPPEAEAKLREDEANRLMDVGGFGKSITLTVEFESVEQRDRAKVALNALAKEDGKKAGASLLRLLRAQKALGRKRAA